MIGAIRHVRLRAKREAEGRSRKQCKPDAKRKREKCRPDANRKQRGGTGR